MNTTNAQERNMTVKAVSATKSNKKGFPYISVKDDHEVWWYVDEAKLFPLLTKGTQITCLVTTDNDFKKIVDVVVDDHLVTPRKGAPGQPNIQLDRIEETLEVILNKITDLGKPNLN